MTTLLISDLHLDAAHPAITRQFLEFLQSDARKAKALYILGDLFEVWIGDDDPDPDKLRIQQALKRLTDAGVECLVMHGNRDFLLGRRFCAATGCRLIEDGTLVNLHGRRVLLLHGDTLCTDDHSYQRLRRIVRNPVVQWVFRRLSLKRRQELAQRIRAGSKAHLESVTPQIMDVNDETVAETFRSQGIDLMVHGHTHRPAVHRIEVDGKEVKRIVLGDWYTQGSVLRWDDRGYELLTLPRGTPE